MNKNIYVKKINTAGDSAVWLVDGALIRKEINENFVKSADNNQFNFVPKNELWIDEDLDPKEYRYFIDRFIYEQGLLDSGENYAQADKRADEFEKNERQNSTEIKRLSKLNFGKKEFLEKIKKKIIKKFSSEIKIWLVDGNLVRSFFLLDYCEGGHDLVYPFIPKNEIWIEQAISPQERKYIILHELHERYLMSRGKSYKNAHIGATEVEDYYRENTKENLEARIKEEMGKNKYSG